MPKVSVCIPTYNRSHYLTGAIASVQAQNYSDFELIVCDDGSQDGTPELMATLTDPRIHYLRHTTNIGKSNNMISGFQAAQGEYFIKFDDDDRLTPEFLSKTVAVLEAHPHIDWVSTDHWVIDPQNRRDLAITDANSARWGRTILPAGEVADLLDRVFVQQSLQIGASLFRKSVLDEVNYMRPNLQNCEDNDLLVRLAIAGKRAYYLPERLMEYRFHPEQQGIDRAIPYLTDKLHYLEFFEFADPKLEGLRLIEKGETLQGTALLQQGFAAAPLKARVGRAIALLPPVFRPWLFAWMRRLKPSAA